MELHTLRASCITNLMTCRHFSSVFKFQSWTDIGLPNVPASRRVNEIRVVVGIVAHGVVVVVITVDGDDLLLGRHVAQGSIQSKQLISFVVCL